MKAKEWIVGQHHIGVPAKDIEKSVAFYQSLGFEITHQPKPDVYFLTLGNTVIETYADDTATGKPGAFDHLAFEVKNVDSLFEQMKKDGYELFNEEIQLLPEFFERGMRYFMIVGPNGEKVEFAEAL